MTRLNIYKGEFNDYNMGNKIVLSLFLGLFMLSFISAADSSFIFKQNQQLADITLQVLNADNSEATASASCYLTIKDKDLVIRKNHQAMIFIGNGFFTLDISSTLDKIGQYSVNLNCDDGATSYLGSTFYFEVTPTGSSNNPTFYFIIFIISLGVIIFGFAIKNGWIAVLGSFGLVYLGLYIILYGINGVKDTVYTWGFGIILLAVAGYIGIKSAFEMIEDM